MTTYTLTRSIPQKLSFFTFPRISLLGVWILFFIFFLFILSFYIFQVSEMAKTSFLVSNYEKQVTSITQENKNLETNLSQVSSLGNLETILKSSNYEKVGSGKIHYIRVLEEVVATKPK